MQFVFTLLETISFLQIYDILLSFVLFFFKLEWRSLGGRGGDVTVAARPALDVDMVERPLLSSKRVLPK